MNNDENEKIIKCQYLFVLKMTTIYRIELQYYSSIKTIKNILKHHKFCKIEL